MIENNNSNSQFNHNDENDIAIIGFGIRFPHDVYDLNQFWELLINKIDGVTEIDQDRCNHSFYHNDEVESNRFGQVNDWKNFDPLFFVDPTRKINTQIESIWNKTCVGKVSIFPHSHKHVHEKEDMDFLLTKCQYFSSANSDEVYQTIKKNSKLSNRQQFRIISDVKLSREFTLSRIDLQKQTSIFDDNSFFSTPLLDFHSIFINKLFPNGCFFHSCKDLKYFASNIPKNRKDHKYLYTKTSFFKLDDSDTAYYSSIKYFLEDGTVLLSCPMIVPSLGSLKKIDESTIMKYPSNSIYSSFYQLKESEANYEFIKMNQNQNPSSNIHLSEHYLPYVVKLLFKSIQERAPFIRKEILSNLSLGDLEKNYFKTEIKWVYLFRTVFKLLKENLELLQDEESDLESVINQTKSIYPSFFEVFYFEKSIPMISGLLFGEPSGVVAQTLISDGSLSRLYNSSQFNECLQLFSSKLCESLTPLVKSKEKRIIRILEFGSGTGTLSRYILEGLERMIQQENEESNIQIEFTFTDISTSFFVEAKQIFNKFNSRNINIVYKLVDISKDFQTQGLNNGFYDFIVMFLVLHVTTHIEPSLQYIYKSLKPGGNLIFVELNRECILPDLLIGIMDQWWGFQDHDLRTDHCCLDPDTWEMVLKKTGFLNYAHISTRIEPLTRNNFTSVDMEYTFINQFLLSKKYPTKHILLTRNSRSENYLNSSLVGIFRSFTEFNELQLYSVDIDSLDNNYINENMISKIEYICNQEHFPEREFIIRNNQVIIENWTREPNNKSKSSLVETDKLSYIIDTNLEPRLKPINSLKSNQVLVRLKSVGLNFRDTLKYRGIIKSYTCLEFSGEIIQVHESVNKFKVGDSKMVNLIQYIVDAISKGELNLIPIKEYEMKNIKDAYNFLIERKNIGKIVITDFNYSVLKTTIQNQIQKKNLIKNEYSIDNRKIGSTVLITGQNGTAFEVIKWIVNHSVDGADVIVLSQSKIQFELEYVQNKLIHDGSKSRIHFRQVDISNIDEIRNSIKDIYQSKSNYNERTINPIESIFHFAFSLHDSSYEEITLEKYNYGHSTKTIGALNLHQLSLELKLNLKNFILCSSVASTLGSQFQCVYMSSNCVINSLSNYRRSIGLPSTTVILGLLPVGGFHSSDVMTSKFGLLGYKMFSIPKMLGIFDFVFQNNHENFLFLDMNQIKGFKPLLIGWDYIKNKYFNNFQEASKASNGDETSLEYKVTNTFASYLFINNSEKKD
eukprot:gene3058-3826_t